MLILAQNRGEGLSGAAFGGGGGGGFYGTKRGAEKVMANATIVLAILFVVLSFAASVV
jgi:protein translocase SecG subunit